MRFREPKDAQGQGIDITPLVDMVFILLIFFMVSTTFIKDMDLDIQRPTATSATPASSKAIRVYIDGSGDTFLDGKPVRTWLIQSRLRDLLKISTTNSVLVVVDESVPANKLVEVVDQCRLAGAKDVGVATKEEVG
ncbi:MAG: biopolymer transporter ExbD [Nitrospirota bacterium]